MRPSSEAHNPKQKPMCCSTLRNFLSSTSIRSFNKIYNSPTLKQRLLWTAFVITMFTLLVLSSLKIIREFLEYNTTLQTRLVVNDPSHFPDITICTNQPFSAKAENQWSRGTLSPNGFNKILRNISLNAFNENDPVLAERVLLYDRLRIYYQNLKYEEALSLSYNVSELLVLCVNFNNNGFFMGNFEDCGMKVTLFSSPDHFNCYTLSPKERYSLSTIKLHLIVRFPVFKFSKDYVGYAFLQDIFKSSVGGVVSIHERNQIPRDSTTKVYLEPGKLIHMSYHNIHWREYSTPTDPCIGEQDFEKVNGTLQDLQNWYAYSYDECVKNHSALEVLYHCHCVMADYPRMVPNATHPYCGEMINTDIDTFRRRTMCVRLVTQMENHNRYRGSVCLRRCVEQNFQTEISNTAWTPKQWQLDWLMQITQSWGKLSEHHLYSQSALEEINRTIGKYLESASEEELKSHHFNQNDTVTDHQVSDYGCLVIERIGNNTTVKEERLSLTTLGLISRIGGSCSLYLGLTCIFFIELIDICLLSPLERCSCSQNVHQPTHQHKTLLPEIPRNLLESDPSEDILTMRKTPSRNGEPETVAELLSTRV